MISRGLVLLVALATPSTGAEEFIGSLSEIAHQVEGDVYVVSDRVIEFRNFKYDGFGMFWTRMSFVTVLCRSPDERLCPPLSNRRS